MTAVRIRPGLLTNCYESLEKPQSRDQYRRTNPELDEGITPASESRAVIGAPENAHRGSRLSLSTPRAQSATLPR